MRFRHVVLVLALAVLVAACGTTGLAQLATITSSYADPIGDADLASAGTDYDVTKMVTRRIDNSPFGSYDTLQIEFTFNQAVVLPPAGSAPDGAGTQLVAYVAFDVDQDANTGGIGVNCIPTGGSTGTGTWGGIEFVIAEDTPWPRLANGNFQVLGSGLAFVGEASVAVSNNVLTVNVPLSTLSGDDGATHASSVFGNRAGGGLVQKDCAPNPSGSVVTRERTSTIFRFER
jgi:hypothetical protein